MNFFIKPSNTVSDCKGMECPDISLTKIVGDVNNSIAEYDKG
jgi:hypothetical protein